MIRLLPGEREEVTRYIYSVCAITLDHSKDYLIEGRLGHLVEEYRCGTFSAFVRLAQSDSAGRLARRIIDEITTGETLFFRDNAPFELLRHKIIPDLIDRRSRTGPRPLIRIWSAACSTGQELYSIAITLRETLGDLARYDIRLLGTDISDQAVARASAGIFGPVDIERGLPGAIRSKYFLPSGDGRWKIRDEIRALTAFRRLNLMHDLSSVGIFDVVFCRNVAIYFSESDRVSLFARIGERLASDGYLMIGAMESLNGISPQFEAKRHLRSAFYQLTPAAGISRAT